MITLTVNGKARKTKTAGTIADVVKKEKLNDETLVILLNGKLAHETTKLKDGDKLELVGIIYGG